MFCISRWVNLAHLRERNLMYNYYNLLSCTKTEVSKETPRMNSQFFLTKMENRKKKKKKKTASICVDTKRKSRQLLDELFWKIPRQDWKRFSRWSLENDNNQFESKLQTVSKWSFGSISRLDYIGNCRNVRELGKSIVVFRLLEKLRYSNERLTKF